MSVKRVSGAVEKVISSGGLTAAGYTWRQRGAQPHEVEVRDAAHQENTQYGMAVCCRHLVVAGNVRHL